jgi:hypothetical protein
MITKSRARLLGVLVLMGLAVPQLSIPADHNDPNAINAIFWDVKMNGADLYDLYGFPTQDARGQDRVAIALTFGAVPSTGVLDPDLLYRVLVVPAPRVTPPTSEDKSLKTVLDYFDAVKSKYLRLKPFEVRVRTEGNTRVKIDFLDFPGGAISQVIDTNRSVALKAPDGGDINVYVGGRDDAFFNDLPGFFRSINYAPQFYKVPHAMVDSRELAIPKTLLELDGNRLFNFDPANPTHGQGLKLDLPPGPHTWSGNAYKKDANGRYRFVYSGRDAQAGMNVNAVIVEMPLAYLTKTPQSDRIVNAWGESWVRKASGKIAQIPDGGAMLSGSRLLERAWLIGGVLIAAGVLWIVLGILRRSPRPQTSWLGRPAVRLSLGGLLVAGGFVLGALHELRPGQSAAIARASMADELQAYKLVDTDGQPFADAALNQREDARQVGAFNVVLGPTFVTRLAHLGWGFAPSVSALGLKTSFDHDNAPLSVHRTYDTPVAAFPRVRRMLFQPMRMPDNTWNRRGVNIPLKRAFEVFVPNVCAIDMDTTGTWPFGRRLEDQVATRFLAVFLDMEADFNGQKYNIETLQNQAALDTLPLEPRTPPNPLKNDKDFLTGFPYLADPWPSPAYVPPAP